MIKCDVDFLFYFCEFFYDKHVLFYSCINGSCCFIINMLRFVSIEQITSETKTCWTGSCSAPGKAWWVYESPPESHLQVGNTMNQLECTTHRQAFLCLVTVMTHPLYSCVLGFLKCSLHCSFSFCNCTQSRPYATNI